MNIPSALVLGCNDPVTVGVLSDWILDHCGFEVDFWESGWDDRNSFYSRGSLYNLHRNTGSGFRYGGYTIFGVNGDGHGNGFGMSDGAGDGNIYGDNYGTGNGFGDGNGYGYNYDSGYHLI